jgi:mannosyltransferase OCH1-like enzyme
MKLIKYIFQTWKTTEIPDKWKEAQKSIITKNPDYKYKLYTDKDNRKIIKKYFSFFLKTYDSFEYHIQRVDAARYCILYLYGGIYLDLDYVCNKSFNEIEKNITLSNQTILLNKSINQSWSYTNSLMISITKNNSFWLKCIYRMMQPLPWYIFGKHLTVMNSTGPLMLTRVIKNNMHYVYTLDIIQSCDVCNIDYCPINNKYILTPIAGSSWISTDTKIYIWMYCNRYKIIIFIIILIICIIIYKKYKN